MAVKGFASHDVIMACLSHDIIVVDQIGTEKLVHLSEGSGSEILTYIQQADEVRGMFLLIQPMEDESCMTCVYVAVVAQGQGQ